MAPVAAALCFVASAFLQGRNRDAPADSYGGLQAKRRICRFNPRIFSPAATGASDRKRAFSSLHMGSTRAAAAAAAASVWLTCGEHAVHECPAGSPLSSPQGFLLANDPGPYTCLRTVGHRSAAMLRFHLNRLWESAEATGLGAAARAEGRQSLERRTTKTIARAMESFWEENANAAEGCPECMVTVLYACGGSAEDTAAAAAARHSADDAQRQEKAGAEGRRGGLQISAHAWPLPAPPRGGRGRGAEVLVAGSGRELPWAKHSSWLRERRRLDELKARVGAQEVVLSENEQPPEGSSRRLLLEGLTSNFFVVEEDGAVCTAPSGVLLGGMRQRVISACEREGIPFRPDPPDIARAGLWREAFLTGTGRVLTPVAALVVYDDEGIDNATDASKSSSSIEATVSKLEISCLHGGAAIGAGEATPSVAQTLRNRVMAELVQTATRLLNEDFQEQTCEKD